MSDSFYLKCSECGSTRELDCGHSVCPACSRLRQPGEPLRGVFEIQIQENYLSRLSRPQSLHDTRELAPVLPVRNHNSFPGLAMPLSPLYQAHPSWKKPHQILLKDDTRQPTGSLKDRATQLVVANALERNCDTICAASTGNAGSSLAGLSAAAGLRSVVLVPASAPAAKLTQTLAFGALLLPVDGSYDDAFELSLQLEQETGWINRNTAWNPYTIEGKKTAAIEIAYQLDWQVPDVVFVPTGDGAIISGLYKGFSDCLRLGWIDRLPRLVAVQAEGSSVVVDSLQDSSFRCQPGSHTVADSICVDAPRNLDMALQAIRDTNGAGVKVSDDEIIAAVSEMARLTGVFAEPAAAAAWAGAHKWLQQETGPLTAVLMITGSGLKAADRIGDQMDLPAPVSADLNSILSTIDAHTRTLSY